MENTNNILGCFVSSMIGDNFGPIFRDYIYLKHGIKNKLTVLNATNYGLDLNLALFQFYVNSSLYELENLKNIENYRKKEKSIGIPIIINDENFFSKSEEQRWAYLRQTIFEKLDLLSEVVKKKKLDTNMALLISDLEKAWPAN